ncbi:hypothetical protein Hanom_Chr11g01025461 [Helianthus anomalus]
MFDIPMRVRWRFFLEILSYYKFISPKRTPSEWSGLRHFEFLCRSMHIEPTGFYFFAQRDLAKKILSNPPKSFHEWKPKFFFIKVGVIPMKMVFRSKEDVVPETIQTPFSETWYQV